MGTSGTAVGHCATVDMFCAQKAVNSASVLPNGRGALAFLTLRLALPFAVCIRGRRDCRGWSRSRWIPQVLQRPRIGEATPRAWLSEARSGEGMQISA